MEPLNFLPRAVRAAALAVVLFTAGACGEAVSAPVLPVPWPPRVGATYPDLELVNRAGKSLRLSSFRGKVILVEPVGMSCPACNAFSGANAGLGGFRGLRPQEGVQSIETLLQRKAKGVKLRNPDLVLVQVLLYDYEMGVPDVQDARDWAQHFGLSPKEARVVVPRNDLRGPASYNLIPGFHLVDRDFVLRYDATGHNPRDDLWSDLLPAIPRLLDR